MNKRLTRVSAAVFFCSMGSVYSGWALAASDANPSSQANPADTAAPDLDKAVKVGTLGQIDLHVKDQDLTRILQLLSIQSQRNIIVNKGVGGTVTADLYGVDFYQALDALLHSNGLGYLEKGNFIYVYTDEDLKRIKEAERKTETKVFRLNYLTADDANTFLTPLLSSMGKIEFSKAPTAGFTASTGDGGANTFANTDTLVISDYPENLEKVAAMVKELDTRPKQVLVEATVLSAALTEDNALGVNISILTDFDFPSTVAGSNIGNLIGQTGGAIGNSGQGVEWKNIIATDNSFRVGLLSKNIAAFIEALDKVTDVTTLANPKLLVLNRQKANLLVGTKFPYLDQTTTDSGQSTSTKFLDTGTELAVRPFVGDEDIIRLEIQPKVSDATLIDVGSSVMAPKEDIQQLTTNIMVHSGQTVVLGGLFKEDTTVTRKQTPIVGDVPILGYAFKGKSDNTKRNEFIFLLTPSVVKDQAMYAAGERAKDDMELARIGARQGLLPWSRSKLTSAYLRNAMTALEQGKRDRAMFFLDMTLSMDPTFVEARRLKEQLTQKRLYTPYDSMFNDSISRYIRLQENTLAPAEVIPPVKPQPKAPVQETQQPKPLTDPALTPSPSGPDSPAAPAPETPSPAGPTSEAVPATPAPAEPAAEAAPVQEAAPTAEAAPAPAVAPELSATDMKASTTPSADAAAQVEESHNEVDTAPER